MGGGIGRRGGGSGAGRGGYEIEGRRDVGADAVPKHEQSLDDDEELIIRVK